MLSYMNIWNSKNVQSLVNFLMTPVHNDFCTRLSFDGWIVVIKHKKKQTSVLKIQWYMNLVGKFGNQISEKPLGLHRI